MRVLTNFVRTAVPALLGLLLAPTAVLAQVSDCPVEPAPNVSIASGNVFAGPNCVLYTQGDVDSFVFSANSGDTYRLAASEVNEVCDQDIALALYDPNQVRIFTSPTNSCEGAYSIVTNQTLTTTGNYTMVVTLAGYGPGTRTYGVSLERLSPIPPNAQQITLAQVAAGDITPLTDSNAFTWTGVTTCTYQVTATMTPGGCRNDLCMNVYFPDGTSTATQCTNSCESQYTILLSFKAPEDGPLMVLVYNNSNNVFSYTLDVSCLVGDCAAISGISPNSAAAGGLGFNLTVNGSGFLSGESVQWNGTALSTAYVNGNQLVAAVPSSLIAAPGPASVVVVNPDGVDSNTASFSINQALRFISMPPCRVVDTRDPTKPFGFGPPSLAGEATRSFDIPGGACGIPATAQAYSLNVTVVPDGELGYLTVWPTGQSQPLVSTLNSLDGEVQANAAVVPGGSGGAISVFATNNTDLVLDVNGYFVPSTSSSGLGFYPMTPCRLVDTRPGAPSTIITGALTGGTSTTLPILSSSCHVPSTAQAYSLNFTLVPPGPVNYLTVYPTGESLPIVSTMNDPTGSVQANAAIAPAGTGGSIEAYVTQTTDLVVDINGYFAPAGAGALSLYPLPPCRVLDTRNPAGAPPFEGTLNVNVIGSGCGGTSAAQAYVLNATVVPQGFLGYLTLWPEGSAQPLASTLNAYDGDVTSNMAIVPTVNGEISTFVTNNTYLVLDLFGYFAP
jgi:hypothetical protein